MQVPKPESLLRDCAARAGVVKRNRARLDVNYADTLILVSKWSRSDDWRDRLLSVICACGARKTEVLDKRIKFQEALEDTLARAPGTQWLLQIGVIKDRSQVFTPSEDGDDDHAGVVMMTGKIVTKPVEFGLTCQEVLDAIELVRSCTDTQGLTRMQIGHKYGADLVAKVKAEFPVASSKNARLGTHFLRAIYVNAAFHHRDRRMGGCSLTGFIYDMLCHDRIEHSVSYQTVHIDWGMNVPVTADLEGTVDAEEEEAITTLRRQVAELQSRPLHLIRMSTFRRLVVDPIAPMALSEAGGGVGAGLEMRDVLGNKRQRGIPVGAEVFLRKVDQSWQVVKKPKICRGELRRVPQMRSVINEMQAAGLPMTRANLSRLGFGKARSLSRHMAKVAANIAIDPLATIEEMRWAELAFPPVVAPS
jgi:hypothetical protein